MDAFYRHQTNSSSKRLIVGLTLILLKVCRILKDLLKSLSNINMEFFCENIWQLLTVTYFRIKAPSLMFCRVRNTRRDHSFSTYAKFSGKNKISFPLACIRKCAYQGVRNVSFPENVAYTQNEWSSLVLIFYFFFFTWLFAK